MTADRSAAAVALRDELAEALDRCTCYPHGWSPASVEGPQRDCPAHGDKYAPVDALLPVVRRYADAQVAAERKRLGDEFDKRGGNPDRVESFIWWEAAAIARGQP